jgi:hypothetical protein
VDDGKIQVRGLAELNRALRRVDSDAPKALRLALNGVAQDLVDETKPQFPTVTGRAAASLKARSTRTSARVSVGNKRAAYVPWLIFGGQGRIAGRPAKREFIKEGRWLFPTLVRRREAVSTMLQEALNDVAKSAGLDVS